MAIASLKPMELVPGQSAPKKPRLRGWIHLVATPLALAAGIVLVTLAQTTATKWASAVYLTVSVILFGVSALYHLFYWTPKAELILKRLDHSNIFLLIAGTYTPISIALFQGTSRAILLIVVWTGAAIGILTNLLWPTAPRWFATLLYIILGWIAIWYLPAMWTEGGPAVVLLILGGGLFYTVGAVFYATKRPNPVPNWFGFHELFHLCTVLAWACHCTAAFLVVT